MNYKKTNAPTTTVTHNLMEFSEPTGNIYESVVVMSKRANQITTDIKNDLNSKLKEFGTKNDSLDEEFEDREQIEISRYYERMPKPTLIAEQEFLEGKIYFRNPNDEKSKLK
jgi:DNA-directed RNA polymerase subunit K/omega